MNAPHSYQHGATMFATQGMTRSSLFSEGEKSCLQTIIPDVSGVGLPGCCVY